MQLLTRNDKKFPSIPTGINIGKYVLSKTSIAKINRNISSFESRNQFRLAILQKFKNLAQNEVIFSDILCL